MKTASRILGTAFYLQGFQIQDAPRYGAERRGAPIFAFVRAAHKPINERGVINQPDLVVVADDSLIPVPAAGVLSGIEDDTVLLINSHESSDTWQGRLNLRNRILTLPVETSDRSEQKFTGAVCAAAAARLAGDIQRDSLQQAIRDELHELGRELVEQNLTRALAAYDMMEAWTGCLQQRTEKDATNYQPPGWIDLPFDDARISAPDIRAAANSNAVKTGLWRSLRPVIHYEHCNACWWVCSTFCPDGAIRVSEERLPQIDYDHCKGCMVCLAQCPTHAIEAVPEQNAAAEFAAENGS